MLWPAALDDLTCADRGVVALDDMGDHSLLLLLVWIGVFLGADRLLASVPLLWRTPPALAMRVYPTYAPPDRLLLLWNVFTSLSIVSVALTARSHLAIVLKTLHVGVEAALLCLILAHHQMQGAASAVASAVLTVTVLVLVYPCRVGVEWAETAGLGFDSVNFLVHWVVLCAQRDNADLRTTVRGLGLHALYLVTYLLVNDLHRFVPYDLPPTWRAVLRVVGMLLNVTAVYVFVALARRRLLPPAGAMTVRTWRAARKGTPRAVWRTPDAFTLEDADDEALVPLHRPHRTAYAFARPARQLFAVATAARLGRASYLTHVLAFPWRRAAFDPAPLDEDDVVFVPSYRTRDVAGAVAAAVLGAACWAL